MKGAHAYAAMPIDELYRWFAGEADPTSPTWGDLCRWVADTPELLARLDALPGTKRQPNLFLGAIRYLDGPLVGGPGFLAWVEQNGDAVERLILSRSTQTNEPGRCAVLAPVLASLPQPVVLGELGASAGLCLLPDRYPWLDAPGLVVADRWGLDANPLDASDPDDARWLRALVWPGEDAREARLVAALAVAAEDALEVVRGVLPDDLGWFLAETVRRAEAAGATPVVFHSATLAYLARADRDAVVAEIRASGVRWVSFEGPTVVTELRGRVPDDGRPHFVLALDGEPVARCSPHGAWVDWLG